VEGEAEDFEDHADDLKLLCNFFYRHICFQYRIQIRANILLC
jgi:hypothetical protein